MSYLSVVTADAPRYWWRLADPAGCIAHSIGSQLDPLFTHPAAFGQLGYSGVNSDGGGALTDTVNYLQTVAGISPGAATWSIETWCWPTRLTGANSFLLAWDGSAAPGIQLFIDGTGHLNSSYNANGLAAGAVLAPLQWHHLVQLYDGVNHKLYADALQVGTAVVASGGNFTNQFLLGRRAAAGNQAAAAFAETALYGVALTPAQITNHFLAADATLFRPVWRQGGSEFPNTASGLGAAASLDAILNSVRKVF